MLRVRTHHEEDVDVLVECSGLVDAHTCSLAGDALKLDRPVCALLEAPVSHQSRVTLSKGNIIIRDFITPNFFRVSPQFILNFAVLYPLALH